MEIDTTEIRGASEGLRQGYPNTAAIIDLLIANVAPAQPELTIQEIHILLNAVNGIIVPAGALSLDALPHYVGGEVFAYLSSTLSDDDYTESGEIKNPERLPAVALSKKLRSMKPEEALALFVAAELFFTAMKRSGENSVVNLKAFFKIAE